MKSLFLLLCLVLCCATSHAQKTPVRDAAPTDQQTTAVRKAMFILQAGGKTSALLTNEEADLESIDPNSIESLDVLKGESAMALYGEKGKNGVVIVKLKQLSDLPKHLQDKLMEPKG